MKGVVLPNVFSKCQLDEEIRQREVPVGQRFQSVGQRLCKFIGTKDNVYIRRELNSHRIGWEY